MKNAPIFSVLAFAGLFTACSMGEDKHDNDPVPSVGRTQGNSAEEGVADSTREFSDPIRNLSSDTTGTP